MENNAEMFRDELNPGERIIWKGQPKQGFVLRLADAILIPFSLFWCGFAIVWEGMALIGSINGAPSFFALWGIPFVLVGIYIVAGRFVVDIIQRRKTYYALTDTRAIVISGIINNHVKTIKIKALSEVNISTSKSGFGTITFGATNPMSWFNTGGWPSSGRYNLAPSFDMIENVKDVYRMVKQVQNNEI